MIKVADPEQVTDWIFENQHMLPGDICTYEIKLPQYASPVDWIEVVIEGYEENTEFLFAFGTSLDKAKSNYYPESIGAFVINDSTDPNKWVEDSNDNDFEWKEIDNGSPLAHEWESSPIPQKGEDEAVSGLQSTEESIEDSVSSAISVK